MLSTFHFFIELFTNKKHAIDTGIDCVLVSALFKKIASQKDFVSYCFSIVGTLGI